MKVNMGNIDRVVRGVVGLVLLVAAFTAAMGAAWQWILGIIGVVLLVTAVTGFCPGYLPFGIKTCKTREPGQQE